MFNVINKTPFAVSFSPQVDLHGHDVIQVFMAASCYLNDGRWHVCDTQMVTPLTDIMWDEDKDSSIRYPSQLSHEKPGTDVIVNSHAVAPGGKPVTTLQADVSIANLNASVVVFGDRVWHRGTLSAPRPFVQLPIVRESAFGGESRSANKEHTESHAHNPLGLGWTDPGHPVDENKRLPNIEQPLQLIRSPEDNPMPAGFGAIPPESPARLQFAGTYDDQWRKQRAPFAPKDFNPAFFRTAIPELQFQGFMHGDEAVRLKHLHAAGDVAFNLPGGKPEGTVKIRDTLVTLSFSLQTVVIEASDLVVRMFWQAVTPAPRSVAAIKDIHVALGRLTG